MPLTFEALKGQRFRWCFGGIQILRMHWRWMLPGGGRREPDVPRSALVVPLRRRPVVRRPARRWCSSSSCSLGAGNIALGGGLLFRKLTGFLLAAIPLLVVLGLVRAVALLRRSTGASWRDALGAFMIWQSTSLVVARASVQALFAKEAEFLRTPKTTEDARFWDAIRGNRASAVRPARRVRHRHRRWPRVGFAGPLTAGLLFWPTVAFVAAR